MGLILDIDRLGAPGASVSSPASSTRLPDVVQQHQDADVTGDGDSLSS